jgi:hypothetical protein
MGFRERYNLSGQLLQLFIAGGVALAVLIAAIVALPSHTAKAGHTVSEASGLTQGSEAGEQQQTEGTTSPSGAAASSAGHAGSTTVPGSDGSISSAPGANPAHVSSSFVRAHAPGITNTTIYVGVAYSSQSGAGDRAIGAAGAAPSYDFRNVYNTAVDYANKHGGFAGRKLKALYYDYNLTDDSNTQDQSACAFWTQDNKVFAVPAGDDILSACAEKVGAIPLGGAATAAQYKKYPHLIHPDAIRLDRLAKLTVAGLNRAKYFTGKLGLVTWDDPNYRQVMKDGYLAPLAKLGIKPAQVSYIMVPQQLQALGDMTAATSSAVAKFKSLGIDHVIVQDGSAGVFGGTGLTLEWMEAAKSQRYYPRYGQNTANSPGWTVLPHDEMDHAIAVDSSDYDKSKDEGWHLNAVREKCFKIMADAGYPVASNNANDEAFAGGACDEVFFLQRTLNSGISLITNDTFFAAAERLGTSLGSAVVYGTKLASGRPDGQAMFRTEEYLQSCDCLKYKTPPAYGD